MIVEGSVLESKPYWPDVVQRTLRIRTAWFIMTSREYAVADDKLMETAGGRKSSAKRSKIA
jgi:hypothetical protein